MLRLRTAWVLTCIGLLGLGGCGDDESASATDTGDSGGDAGDSGDAGDQGGDGSDVTPDTATDPDTGADALPGSYALAFLQNELWVPRLASGSIGVQLTRNDGHVATVRLTVEDLPAGVTAEPVDLIGNQTEGTLVLEADEDAVQGLTTVTVVANDGGDDQDYELTVRITGTHGEQDALFGNGQRVQVEVGADASLADILALDDSSLLLVGTADDSLVLARLDTLGSIDETWGDDGYVRVEPDGEDVLAYQVAAALALPGGALLVAGVATLEGQDDQPVVWRFTAAGEPDLTFSGDGVTIPFDGLTVGTYMRTTDMDLDSTGRILLSLILGPAGENPGESPSVLRLTATGAFDSDFGTGGGTTLAPPGGAARALSVVADPDDGVLVAGTVVGEGDQLDLFLARLDDAGDLDDQWAESGFIAGGSNRDDDLGELLIQPSRGVLAVSTNSESENDPDVFLARIGFDGDPDNTFGDGEGVALVDLAGDGDRGAEVVLDSSGRIVIAGDAPNAGADGSIALVRFTQDGIVDESFGTDGVVIAGVTAGTKVVTGLATDPEARYVVGATLTAGEGDPVWLVVRFWP